ncbi:MAG TPA: citrate synthase 2 [Gaiellaceae bacterium]|jgi:citrate synthase|nr:citrate synthase 2 [Gaiellaceae bacterium]
MSTSEYSPGLAGVIAFETEIAEPDREGGSLRYRGIDIEELAGHVPFEQVWGLLVDESLHPGLPAAHCELEVRTGGHMSDLQAMLAILSGRWKLRQLIDIDDETAKEDLRRLSAAALSIVAQSARGADKPPVPEATVLAGETAAERFLLAWRGEVDERHARAIDTYWICTAEHGVNASTFTARIVASTGADCGAALSAAVGALSGPLHGGAPARVLPMLDAVAELGDAEKWVEQALARKERIMGFGHRVYRAEDPRSRLLKRTAKELGSPRVEVAEALEQAAHEAIARKNPDHSYTNVEFWSAIVLDAAEVPPALAPAMFACSRTAGWSAHVLEQKRLGVLVRPSARYVGPGARALQSI